MICKYQVLKPNTHEALCPQCGEILLRYNVDIPFYIAGRGPFDFKSGIAQLCLRCKKVYIARSTLSQIKQGTKKQKLSPTGIAYVDEPKVVLPPEKIPKAKKKSKSKKQHAQPKKYSVKNIPKELMYSAHCANLPFDNTSPRFREDNRKRIAVRVDKLRTWVSDERSKSLHTYSGGDVRPK